MSDFFKLISYFIRSSRGFRTKLAVVMIVVTGFLSGVASTAIIALINGGLSSASNPAPPLAWTFLALVIALPLSRFISSVLLVRVSQGAFHELRMNLSRRILSAPLRQLEQYGSARILASLTDDVGTIGGSLGTLPNLSMNLTIILCCLGYMGWLSWRLLLIVLFFLVVGLVTYVIPINRASRQFFFMREAWDKLFGHMRGLAEGIKELKMHRVRRSSFLNRSIADSSMALRRFTVAGNTIHAAATSWGNILFFVVIGLMLFAVPRYISVDVTVLTGFTLAILFMLGPLEMVMTFLPGLSRANIAIRRVEQLGGELAEHATDPTSVGEPAAVPQWQGVELVGASHSYYREDEDNHFTLGPIDLAIHPGELIFIVGGNGSGKTTLAKLLAGLYDPEKGEVRLDGTAVTDETRDDYRQLFSVVFQDFFLFPELLGLESPKLDEEARGYMKQLQIEKKVEVTDGKLSTLDLSQGQKKRLALLTAYLEDRPIYLFDEWAADQDPQFKELFYLKLLQELHSRGKTVIVISHDDHYYGMADRVIKLDYGQIEFDGTVTDYLAAYGETMRLTTGKEDKMLAEGAGGDSE